AIPGEVRDFRMDLRAVDASAVGVIERADDGAEEILHLAAHANDAAHHADDRLALALKERLDERSDVMRHVRYGILMRWSGSGCRCRRRSLMRGIRHAMIAHRGGCRAM